MIMMTTTTIATIYIVGNPEDGSGVGLGEAVGAAVGEAVGEGLGVAAGIGAKTAVYEYV